MALQLINLMDGFSHQTNHTELAWRNQFTEYFVQVYGETSVSGTPSNIVQAKTLEDGKLFVFIFFSFFFFCFDQNNVVNC